MASTSDQSLCLRCGAPEIRGESACAFCGEDRQGRKTSWLEILTRAVMAYRIWSLGVFTYAIVLLTLQGGVENLPYVFVIVLPFGGALAIAWLSGRARSKWIVAFLLLVDLGVILAPVPRILPFLNMFPALPRTQNRILTWYFVVYFSLQFLIAPPVAFVRSLRTRSRSLQPPLSPWICWFGLASWALLSLILIWGIFLRSNA